MHATQSEDPHLPARFSLPAILSSLPAIEPASPTQLARLPLFKVHIGTHTYFLAYATWEDFLRKEEPTHTQELEMQIRPPRTKQGQQQATSSAISAAAAASCRSNIFFAAAVKSRTTIGS